MSAALKMYNRLIKFNKFVHVPIISQQNYFSNQKIPREPPIPDYEEKVNESLDVKKARLLYQSRKRGMLENDLILSTFASKYLNKMDEDQIEQYDRLINLPHNDWDIYYWATGAKETPPEYRNEVMTLLKEHVNNNDRENRSRQPDLYAE